VIGLLIEKQVTYTEAEADALIAKAKKLAQESGRTVRAEAELLLRDRETRLRDLQTRWWGRTSFWRPSPSKSMTFGPSQVMTMGSWPPSWRRWLPPVSPSSVRRPTSTD
jgi:anti-sigma-K factor RskA